MIGMVIPPGAAGWVPSKASQYLTATERSELLNWACFDALQAVLPYELLEGPRYFNSPEFQPEDLDELIVRMRRVLEEMPAGRAVPIRPIHRVQIDEMLDNCWFSKAMSGRVLVWGNSQTRCYQRARYLFISHWLVRYSETSLPEMGQLIDRAVDVGLSKRYALQDVNFDGSKVSEDDDVHL